MDDDKNANKITRNGTTELGKARGKLSFCNTPRTNLKKTLKFTSLLSNNK